MCGHCRGERKMAGNKMNKYSGLSRLDRYVLAYITLDYTLEAAIELAQAAITAVDRWVDIGGENE